jgi:hypothetical protein
MKSPVMMVLLDCWNWNMNNEPYINAKGHKVLEYISDDTIILDLPFIMTTGKRLTKDMPYMKLEKKVFGEDVAAVRLLGFQDYEGVLYLNVQDLKTNREYNLIWNMEYDGDLWLWTLMNMDSLSTLMKNS